MLKDITIRNAKAANKAYRISDTKRMFLQVNPTGSKAFRLHYDYKGKRSIYTLGHYPDMTLSQAREKRDYIKNEIKRGIHPNALRFDYTPVSNSENFEAVFRKWSNQQTWKESHKKRVVSRIEKNVLPIIGNMAFPDIKGKHIITIMQNIEQRGAAYSAKRINQYCASIFEYAIILELCEYNPCIGKSKLIKSLPMKHRLHMKAEDLPSFMNAAKNAPHYISNLAAHLNILTLLRSSELRGAKLDEFDFNKKEWIVPAERMKNGKDHIVPLSKQAIRVIEQLKKVSVSDKFIMPSPRKGNQPISDVMLIKAVRKLSSDKSTPHGFRHTFSTICNEHGFNYDHIERQLDHSPRDQIRATYNKAQYLPQRHELMQWWADYLDFS